MKHNHKYDPNRVTQTAFDLLVLKVDHISSQIHALDPEINEVPSLIADVLAIQKDLTKKDADLTLIGKQIAALTKGVFACVDKIDGLLPLVDQMKDAEQHINNLTNDMMRVSTLEVEMAQAEKQLRDLLKRLPASASITGGTVVGDVKKNMLRPDQFELLLPQHEKGKWVLADGRDIGGTELSRITGLTHVPDWRGGYFRMAGTNAHIKDRHGKFWDGGSLLEISNCKTELPENEFLGGAGPAGKHNHAATMALNGEHYHSKGTYDQELRDIMQQYHHYTGANPSPLLKGKRRGEDANLAGSAEGTANEIEEATSTDGSHRHGVSIIEVDDHVHVVTIGEGGDNETSPHTYAVNYFIKVD